MSASGNAARTPRTSQVGRAIALTTAIALVGMGITLPAAAEPAEEEVSGEPTVEQVTEAAAPAQEPPAEEAVAAEEIAPALIVTDGDIFISELHYDNAGADVDERIEIEAPVGTDLTGWQVVLYNGGTNGVNAHAATTYDTRTLAETVPDAGVVVLSYPQDGIQNGPNDGIALVDADGAVIELLSYEGALTAANGPAAGLTSSDIGVSQPSNTPIGQSLQRIDGVWTGPIAETFGVRNDAAPGPGPDPDPEPGEVIPIAEIQGTGAASPLVGQTVTTRGLVTAVYPAGGFNGYYIQTPGTGGDEDPTERTASDGLFVYSPATVGQVEIGDHVEITGEVGEYFTLTQISAGAAGVSVLEEPAEAVEPIESFVLPATDAEREVFEGMLVHPADRYVVADVYDLGGWGDARFGSIGLGLDGPLVQETEIALPGTGRFEELVADNAARAVTLDDGQSNRTPFDAEVPYLAGTPDLRVGVEAAFAAPVIVDYRFQWNFQPTEPVTGAADEVVAFAGGNTQAANATAPDVGGDLRLAAFNVLNYFTTLGVDTPSCTSFDDRAGNPLTVRGGCLQRGAWDAASLERQQDKIVTAINGLGADVVGLQEIENSGVFTADDDRDVALATLVEALNADAGSEVWAFAPSPEAVPSDEDVIRTAFIYRTDTVELDGESTILIDDDAFHNAREPLAQGFSSVENPDYSFLAVNNHFKSKGGCSPSPAEGCFDGDRTLQAEALVSFAEETAEAAEIEDIFLLGDFNSYSAENPLLALQNAGYTNVNTDLTPTYTFGGKVGSLDHVFANASAQARVAGADVWSINAEESVLAEYSRWNYFASQHVQEGSQYRSSDHNPILVGIDVSDAPAEPGTTTIDILSFNDFHGRIVRDGQSAGAAVLAGAVNAYRAENENTLFVGAGDQIGASTFVSAVAQDQPTLDVLNEIGLDVSAFGNHEFDRGQDDVNDRVIPESDFPYIAANIFDDAGNHVYDPYHVITVGGVEVGFIGALTEDMPTLVSPAGIEGLVFGDIAESVTAVAEQLTDGEESNGEADVLIVLVHDGAATATLDTIDGTPYGDLIDAAIDNEDIAAVISGHTHQRYVVEPREDLVVIQSGQYGEFLGHIQLEVDASGEWTISSAENVDLIDAGGNALFPADEAVQDIVDEAVENAAILGAVPIGEITADFQRAVQSDGSENRGGESTLGNFVADVQLWATQEVDTEIAFMNPGGLRQDLFYAAAGEEGDGVVTYEEAAIVQPFANTLVALDLTGAQIFEVLEQQWQPAGAARPFLKLGISDGFSYTYDPTAPAGDRILGATLDGEQVEAGTTYRVVVNSFLASGGDAFTTFAAGTNRADTGQVDLDAMVRYFAESDEPVSPDYAQRAVGVEWLTDIADELAPGEEIRFNLSSLAFSRSEPKPEEVTVTIDGTEIGSFDVDTTIVDTTDEVGRAEVSVTVPDGLSGEVRLEVTDPVNGTTVSVPLTIAEDTVVDTERPETTLVAPATAGPFRTLQLQVDATDNVGLQRVVANIYRDGTLVRSTQSAANGATEFSHTATVTGLAEGTYTIRYNASDLAGNISVTRTFTFTIDLTRPTVTLVSPSTAGPFRTLAIQVDAADAGGLARVVANVYRDGTLVRSTQSAASGATEFSHTAAVSGLPEGTYTIRYNAHDVAGNVSATGNVTVSIDLTRPTVTLVSPSTAGPFQTLAIQVDAADAGGLSRVVANVYLGSTLVRSTQSAANGATSFTHTASVEGLPDGTYTIRYNAHDVAGNISATGNVTVTVEEPQAPVEPPSLWRQIVKVIWGVLKYFFPWLP